MFGLGWMELFLLVLLLALVFGAGTTGRLLGRIFAVKRKVGETRSRFTNLLNPLSFFRSQDKNDPPA